MGAVPNLRVMNRRIPLIVEQKAKFQHTVTTLYFRSAMRFIVFPFFWIVVLSQITDIPRDQPLLEGTHATQNCCRYLDDESLLLRCINSSTFHDFTSADHSIFLVSYSTEEILDYGAYSLAINTYYSQLHSYRMVLLTPEQGAQYEPRDQRWNKVKILIDALNGWAKDSKFIVWIDSDLIMLDMGMKLGDIVNNFPSYDMIFSADGDIQNGIAIS